MSEESTVWNFPSTSVTLTSTIGFPLTTPSAIVLTMPFSIDGMNWWGIEPPKILSSYTNPSPRGERLDLDVADGVLAVPARLLHVAALRLGLRL